jgi:hypothetical protein
VKHPGDQKVFLLGLNPNKQICLSKNQEVSQYAGCSRNDKFWQQRNSSFAIESSMMMMIAFITINGGLAPLIEGLCAQILYFRFEIIGGLRSLFFPKEKICSKKKAVSP